MYTWKESAPSFDSMWYNSARLKALEQSPLLVHASQPKSLEVPSTTLRFPTAA